MTDDQKLVKELEQQIKELEQQIEMLESKKWILQHNLHNVKEYME